MARKKLILVSIFVLTAALLIISIISICMKLGIIG